MLKNGEDNRDRFLKNNLLLYFRKKTGLKQHLLAKSMNISDSVLSQIENKKQEVDLELFCMGIKYLQNFDSNLQIPYDLGLKNEELTVLIELIFQKLMDSLSGIDLSSLEQLIRENHFEFTSQIFELELAKIVISFFNDEPYIDNANNLLLYIDSLSLKECCLLFFLISWHYAQDNVEKCIYFINKMTESNSLTLIPGLYGFVNYLIIRAYVIAGNPYAAIPYLNKGNQDLVDNQLFLRNITSIVNVANVYILLKQYAIAKIW